MKILSEGPYLKSFIRRVLCLYRERFSSFSRYCTRLHVEAFFLPPLHRGVGTKAVKTRPDGDNGNKEEGEKDPSYKPSSDYEVNQKVHCIKQNWQPWQK